MDANDRRIDTKSIRLRANNSDPSSGALTIPGEGTTGANVVQMQFDKPNGIGEVSFYYGSYSSHSGGIISVEYSADGGITWIKPANNAVTSPAWNTVNEMQKFTVQVEALGNARVRIIKYKQTGTNNSVNIDNICITDFTCDNCAATPTFSPGSGNYGAPVNVSISSSTAGATIRYTLDGSAPTEASTLYETPIPISIQTTIMAKAWKDGMEPSPVGTANYTFSEGISTLAELREKNTGGTVYKYTGQAVVTQIQQFNSVKYIQDGTAAIMLFQSGKLTDVQEGDKITNISGTLNSYFGMLQFTPNEDCDVISWNNKITPTTITASQLNYDSNNPIQAKLVILKDVSYIQTGSFATGTYYSIKENSMVHDSVVYTDKYEADYIGASIPTYLTNITGVINFKGSTGILTRNRIVPLDNSNPVVKITDINQSAIKLSPNPATNYVNIVTGSPMKLEIYSLLGTLVAVENLDEGSNLISVSRYPAGVYLMKMTDSQTGQAVMQKLVVQ
jgi:hypothetical protein